MDREKLSRLAGFLQQASDVVRSSIEEPTNNANGATLATASGVNTLTTNTSSDSSGTGRNAGTSNATNSIAETLSRARRMMQASSNAGLYRRLNQNERLRATASTSTTGGPKSKKSKKEKEKKPLEFALLKAKPLADNDDDSDVTLKKENVVERGIIELSEDDNEQVIRQKLLSSLKATYSIIGPNDFEFVKVTQKRISVLRMAEGTEYNFAVVKKLAGQGLLYIRITQGYEFVLNETSVSDDEFPEGLTPDVLPDVEQAEQSTPNIVNLTELNETSSVDVERPELSKLEDRFQTVITEFPSDITEPTEILRYLQSKIHRGRPLDIVDDTSPLEGETNFISVDRENILQTTFEELKEIKDPSVTFEVDFYGERA